MLTLKDIVKFGALVGLCGILVDSMLAHALFWENDPYWTYWITKTFLIGTIFSLGTAWLGIGALRGAIMAVFNALILSIYYWTFSPIGLPDKPEWLDFNHAWVSGIPIHALVIFIGYLTALWLWRSNRATGQNATDYRPVNITLIKAIGAVLLMGLLSSVFLGQFVGVTWFVTRLLITFPLLLFLAAYLPKDGLGTLGGALIASLALTAYSHYLSPLGLPGQWRLFSIFTPVTTPVWLDYGQLWFRQFPGYFVTLLLTLSIMKNKLALS